MLTIMIEINCYDTEAPQLDFFYVKTNLIWILFSASLSWMLYLMAGRSLYKLKIFQKVFSFCIMLLVYCTIIQQPTLLLKKLANTEKRIIPKRNVDEFFQPLFKNCANDCSAILPVTLAEEIWYLLVVFQMHSSYTEFPKALC